MGVNLEQQAIDVVVDIFKILKQNKLSMVITKDGDFKFTNHDGETTVVAVDILLAIWSAMDNAVEA